MGELGYRIPETKAMLICDVAIALGAYKEAALPEAAAGYAYPDPRDPHSHLRMRAQFATVADRIALERYGRTFLKLTGPEQRLVRDDAVKEAPLPVARPERSIDPDLLMSNKASPYVSAMENRGPEPAHP